VIALQEQLAAATDRSTSEPHQATDHRDDPEGRNDDNGGWRAGKFGMKDFYGNDVAPSTAKSPAAERLGIFCARDGSRSSRRCGRTAQEPDRRYEPISVQFTISPRASAKSDVAADGRNPEPGHFRQAAFASIIPEGPT